jgi:hypothetical protein
LCSRSRPRATHIFNTLLLVGITTFLPETARNVTAKLDWFGFGALSLTIAAFQVMLDRGEQLDWFGSGENTLMSLGEGVTTLEGQHWLMLLVILVVGYVLGRLWTTPAQMVGLP